MGGLRDERGREERESERGNRAAHGTTSERSVHLMVIGVAGFAGPATTASSGGRAAGTGQSTANPMLRQAPPER